MFSYIDVEKIREARPTQSPFPWLNFGKVLAAEKISSLTDNYPSGSFNVAERIGGTDKNYRFSIRYLIKQGELQAMEDLSACWHGFLSELTSPQFVEALSTAAGINLIECKVDVGFYRFDKGDWASPHVDKERKRLALLFYFSPSWQKDWGGLLQIMTSSDHGSVKYEITPETGNAAGILRSDQSWHAVSPITEKALHPRQTVQIEYWNPQN